VFLVRASELGFSYPASRPLFADVQFSIESKDRIILVGPNGAGKSTLVSLLAGELMPAEGNIQWNPGARLRIVRQTLLRPDDVGSGGERRFRDIMDSILPDADLLILDEPTNHLDQDHTDALIRRLESHGGAFLVITHDRRFGDRLARITWLLDHGRLRILPGGPSHLLEVEGEEARSAWATYAHVRSERERLEEAARQQAERAARAHRAAGHRNPGPEARAKRMDRKATAMKRRADREKSRLQLPDLPPAAVHWRGRVADPGPPVPLRAVGLGVSRGRLRLVDLSLVLPRGGRLTIAGRNGAGKTTLLETLAGLRAPEAGRVERGPGVRLAYSPQLLEEDRDLTVVAYLQSHGVDTREAQIMATGVGLTGDRLRLRTRELSGGEQRRLAILGALAAGAHVLFLDEPTLDLDMPGREALYGWLPTVEAAVVAATHDPLLVEAMGVEPLDLSRLEGGRALSQEPAVDAEEILRRIQAARDAHQASTVKPKGGPPGP
jgi:ATPase subunit of ABC transporter with duplicated ATPase domains